MIDRASDLDIANLALGLEGYKRQAQTGRLGSLTISTVDWRNGKNSF